MNVGYEVGLGERGAVLLEFADLVEVDSPADYAARYTYFYSVYSFYRLYVPHTFSRPRIRSAVSFILS